MCTARNHVEELIILCAGKKKKQALCCSKCCLTFLALGLTVQNDETSAISQDNGSRSVFNQTSQEKEGWIWHPHTAH